LHQAQKQGMDTAKNRALLYAYELMIESIELFMQDSLLWKIAFFKISDLDIHWGKV